MMLMTEEELKSIKNLKISNEFGEIKWIGVVDVRGVNFDESIDIRKAAVEVYRENLPPLG